MKYEVIITYETKYRYLVEAENEEEAKRLASVRDDNNDDDGECGGCHYDVYEADEDDYEYFN